MLNYIVSLVSAMITGERARGVEGLSGWRHATARR